MKKISIIGLGKLGACMAATYSNRGFEVIGLDINQSNVDAINNKKAPVKEPQLQEFIETSGNNLTATTDYEKAILGTEASFIIVPTPTDETGGFSTIFAEKACEKIGVAMAKKNGYHLVVMTSTVLPGDCEKKLIPTLEKFSGKKCGRDFGFCYNPEFIAIGSVIKNLLNPDFLLVGEYDEKSGKMLEEFYTTACDNKAPVERMSISSAELTKISVNAYVTTKITFANMIAEIAEKIPGADAARILEAMGKDKRIGSSYFKIGLGFGGPCFPRDNVAFAAMAAIRGCDAAIPKITHSYNNKMADRIAEIILANTKTSQKIGFLGIAYKTDTPVVEESHALKIAQKLISKGYNILVHEPAGYEHASKELPVETLREDMSDLFNEADVYFLSTPDKKFLALTEYLADKKNKSVIDPWGIFKNNNFNDTITYITLGLGK